MPFDYEKAYKEFDLPLPTHFNFTVDVIDKWAAADPLKLAMLWVGKGEGEGERRLTFAHFSEASHRTALVLTRELGIRKGERVLVMLPRVPEWWETVLGLIRIGAIPIPCTTLLTPRDLQFRAELSEAAAIVTDHDGAAKFDQVVACCPTVLQRVIVGSKRDGWFGYEALMVNETVRSVRYDGPKTKSTDPCLIYFTSGTTSYPKMTLLPASYPLGLTIAGKFWLNLNENDLHWNLSDMGWAKAAWSNLFAPWICKAVIFIQDNRSPKFDPINTLTILHRYPITTFCAPPTAYRMLVLADPLAFLRTHRPRSLRHCVGAGEPLNPEVIKLWHATTGLMIRDGYGQTETVLICGNFPDTPIKPGSMGRPAPGIVLSVIDDDGNEVGPDVEGDIAVHVYPVRPPWMFSEYWRNREKTAGTLRGNWYVTGDRAYRDADGYFFFVGRSDDVIISAGYRIGPFEVESALKGHPAVAESAVVASPDAMRGEVVKAFVVLTEEFKGRGNEELVSELQEYVKTETSPYKYPREIEFVEILPKTISGKIRRVELREAEKKKSGSLKSKL